MKYLNLILLFLCVLLLAACHDSTKTEPMVIDDVSLPQITSKKLLDSLATRGFETFSYEDEKTGDTIVMQKYFLALLKRGDNRDQNKAEADSLQVLHMAHLSKMYDLGYADISGPMGDDGDLRGITIYNVPTFAIADSLANADPMVKAGRLKIEIKPWWAAKGYGLR